MGERVHIGDLIHYRFGRSEIVGVVVRKYVASRWAAPSTDYLFTMDVLESDGVTSPWDIYELDLVTDKLNVLQPVKSSTTR